MGVDTEHPTPSEQHERIWKALLDHGNTNTEFCQGREWPTYKTIMEDISSADYTQVLQCPHDVINKTINQDKANIRNQEGKAFCAHGAIGCVKMEIFPFPSNETEGISPYTGLLEPGKTVEHCIIRLSSAMKPPSGEKNKFGKFFLNATGGKLKDAKLFPMVALKAFRDNGQRSGNLLFAGRKIGQVETNFFAHTVCTQMTERVPIAMKPFIRKFYSYSENPLSLGVSDFCRNDGDGGMICFPYVVMLHPVYIPEQHQDSTREDADFDHFLEDVTEIPIGSTLFDIFVCPEPSSALDGSKIQRIGKIITTSDIIKSSPEDGLFFRHQRKEEDFDLCPEWKNQVKAKCSPDNGKTVGTIDKLVGATILENLIKEGNFIDFESEASK